MEQFLDLLGQLDGVDYMVADGNYARSKVFDTITGADKHLVTRLRCDANLRYLHDGSRRPGQRGRTPRYAGKVDKRDFRVVVLLNRRTGKYVVSASTDVNQGAAEVVAY